MKLARISMKKVALGMLLMLSSAATVQAQGQPPKLLFQAVRCLAAKKFLPSSVASKLTFGYILDKRSYPGRTVVYLVAYAAPSRSNGQIYAVFVTKHSRYHVFNIQNNATFILSKNELSGVYFVTPPLGGTWTHAHLASAIREIEKKPRFSIRVPGLSTVGESIVCDAYTDSK